MKEQILNIPYNVHKRFKDLPSVQTPLKAVGVRKSSDNNLANLLNMSVLLIGVQGERWANDLIGVCSAFYDFVMLQVELNPETLIKELKDAYSVYIGWFRGAPLPGKFDSEFRFLQRGSYSEVLRALAPVLALQWKLFGDLRHSKHSTKFIAVVVSMLSCYRVLVMAKDPDYTSVVAPYTGKAKMEDVKAQMKTVLSGFFFTPDEFKERLLQRGKKWRYVVSMKGGPNGKAIMTSTADARALIADEGLTEAFYNVADFLGMGNLFGTLTVMGRTTTTEGVPLRGLPVTGRLHAIEEWGGKVRIVALLDYWTQTLLRPLHQTMGEFLARMGPDAVYDQNKAADKVKYWTSVDNSELHCYDLSNATDRLPVEIQEYTLGILTGNADFAKHWRFLLTNRDYWAPDGKARRYAVGQPMGALSSFASFDLTHHVLVQVAAREAGYTGLFEDYVMIGDDIAIFSTKVALKYRALMESLGVAINLSKSLVGAKGLKPAGEIAKRLFVDGTELSTIPVKLLAKLPRFGKLAPVVQDYLTTRGALPADKRVLTFLQGGTDRESMTTLLRLNAVPGSVTGLKNPVGHITENLKIMNWSKTLLLEASDIIDAYTYIVITEQLKRLDALLRESDTISQLLVIPVDDKWEATGKIKELYDKFMAASPSWDRRHPMMVAAFEEARRVSRTLSGLRAGTHSLSEVARRGLLDSLRNSVWTHLDMNEEEEGQVTYALFNSMLGALARMAGQGEGRVLEFTIPLLALSRSYTVTWRYGKGVFVNAVRSRISTDAEQNEKDISMLSSSIEAIDSKLVERYTERRLRREGSQVGAPRGAEPVSSRPD